MPPVFHSAHTHYTQLFIALILWMRERERDKFAKISFTFDVLQAIKQIIFGLASAH